MIMKYARRRLCGTASWVLISAAALLAAPVDARPISEREAVEAALAQRDFAALGEAELAAAEARVRSIPRFDNPEASISRESVSGSAGRETEWHAGVAQAIDLSGQRSSLRQAARAEAQAVLAEAARRRQERVAETREAYAGCAASAEKAAIAERFAIRLKEAERIVDLRTRAGDTASYDLRRLRVEARSAEAELRLAQGELSAECAALSRLTAIADARPSQALAAMLPPSPAAAAARTAANRQDLIAREARVAAATAEVAAARRGRLPELSVDVGYKRISSDEGTAAGPAVGLGIRLPLFDNGGAAISEARARQRVKEAELALARRDAEASIESAAARAAAATVAARQAGEAAEDATRLGTIAEAAYQGGETGVIELVDAYRTARDAQLTIVELTERAIRASIAQSLAEGRE